MSIAHLGRLGAIKRKESTCQKVFAAMRQIEQEVDIHSGVYPFNGGRICVQEVLRRAGLSSAALEKARHRELRDEVHAWLCRIQKNTANGAKSVRKAVFDSVLGLKLELSALMQQWTEAELRYIEDQAASQSRIADLERDLSLLRNENPTTPARARCHECKH